MSSAKTKLLGLCCIALLPSATYAEKSGFYTIIGPDGHVIVIDRSAQASDNSTYQDNSTTKQKWNFFKRKKYISTQVNQPAEKIQKPTLTDSSKVSKTSPNVEIKDSIQVRTPDVRSTPSSNPIAQTNNSKSQQSLGNKPTNSSIPMESESVTSVAVQAKQPVQVIDGQEYIDSEYLEQREFNLEGKKRFYNLPDGLGGNQILEREKGVDMSIFRSLTTKPNRPKVINLAKDYQRISREKIVELTGVQCFSDQQLKKAKLLQIDEPLNLWPRPAFEPKFDFIAAQVTSSISDLELTSYAKSMTNPEFYWPLPIFLDEKGCVLEGVNAFYQRDLPATVTSHQALQGYLHLPEKTQYILLTPLETAADLSQKKLTNTGQVRLIPVR